MVTFAISKYFLGNSLYYKLETKHKEFIKYNDDLLKEYELFSKMKDLSSLISDTSDYGVVFEIE